MVKVSVIVPVYNAEKYLAQCIGSIISQTLREIEIICVDDGSSDKSLSILNSFAEEDKRITILRQDHGYAGAARNRGMEEASGKYLVFWDSDDYFKPKALEEMYNQCEKDSAQVCVCGGRQYYDREGFEAPGPRYLRKSEIPEVIPFNALTEPDHIISMTVEAPWNKMFLREFIEQQGLRFQAIRNANDVYFVINALCLAERVTLVNKPLVVYRKSKDGGLVSSVSKGLITAFQAWLDTAENLRRAGVFPERSFVNRCFESILYLLNNTNDWYAYKEAYLFLKQGNLEKLGIVPGRGEDYYYIRSHDEKIRKMYEMTPEEYCKWMGTQLNNQEAAAGGRRNYEGERYKKTIAKNRKEIQKLKEDLEEEKTRLAKTQQDLEKQKAGYEITIDQLQKQKSEFEGTIKKQQEQELRYKETIESSKKKIAKLEKESRAAKENHARLKRSWSFRIGRAVTFVPRKIRDCLRKLM